MKKRNLILTALTATFAIASVVAFGGVNTVTPSVKATENDNAYWEQFFDVETKGTVEFDGGKAVPTYLSSVSTTAGSVSTGLGVYFNDEATITYKTPILVDSLDGNNTIVELYPSPVTQSNKPSGYTSPTATDCEFSKINIRLTGVEFPEEFIDIHYFRSAYDVANAWARVATNTMDYAGVKKGIIDSTKDKGTPVSSPFTGVGSSAVAFKYDSVNHTVAASKYLYNEKDYAGITGLIRDLDSPSHLLGSDSIFKGFNSKYVKLSITFGELTNPYYGANCLLTSVMGQQLQTEKFNDVGKPLLSFPKDYSIDATPIAEKDTYYPFWNINGFDAIEGDISSSIKYDVKYLGVNGDQDPVDSGYVKDAYGFTPSNIGIYQVTANLKDSSNNVANSIVAKVESFSIVESINFDLNGTIPSTASVGQTIKVPTYQISGGSGNIDVDFSVTFNNRTEKIEVYNNEFDVLYAGVYNVTYVISDYLGKVKVVDFPIASSLSDKPIVEDAVLPSVYKKGSYLLLNKPTAYDYASFPGQKIEVDTTIEVAEVTIVEGAEVVGAFAQVNKNAKGQYKYSPSDNAVKLQVRYKASTLVSKTEVITEPKEVVICEPETLDSYWYNVNGGITRAYEYEAEYDANINTFTVQERGATLEYIMPLQAEAFAMSLDFEEYTAYFKSIKVSIVDSVNKNESVTFNISTRDDKSVFIGSQEAPYANVSGQIYNVSGSSSIYFRFKLGYQIVDSIGSPAFSITQYDDGSEYKQFTSGKAYVKITVEDFDDSEGKVNKFRISRFYSQTVYQEDAADIGKPVISTSSHIATYYNYLEELTIPSAVAYDLYVPNVDVYVTVFDPNENIILDKVLADKEQKLLLNQNGTYTIEYSASDNRNKPRITTFSIQTLDVIKPVIEINGQIKTTVKTGEVLRLPEYIVTDNVSSSDELLKYIYLETPSFGYKTIAIGNNYGTYKFQQKGTYNLVYFAMDKSGNYTYKTFTIKVTD